MQEYQLTLNDKRIVWGKAIDIEPLIGKYPGDSIRQGVNAALDWNLPAGIYRAKEIVMGSIRCSRRCWYSLENR